MTQNSIILFRYSTYTQFSFKLLLKPLKSQTTPALYISNDYFTPFDFYDHKNADIKVRSKKKKSIPYREDNISKGVA